jgi:hypothetical protein
VGWFSHWAESDAPMANAISRANEDVFMAGDLRA